MRFFVEFLSIVENVNESRRPEAPLAQVFTLRSPLNLFILTFEIVVLILVSLLSDAGLELRDTFALID